ncbi:type II secretion system protein [Comamonas testosteroni]|uniref:type II secretion system protein n=1 Tax=Comamonas testosteroni TaxID=285 RepID=UPI00265E3511|nr:type II secretion system protein [Comamonas testosteroni]WKL15219.1 type II secretion system protein [Comamonas testosteroni]
MELHAMGRRMRTGERGFGYVFLLVVVAVLGYVSAYSISRGDAYSRRQAEQELLLIGREFEAALYSYSGMQAPAVGANLPIGVIGATGPEQLSDLVRDPRSPGIRRHLRKLYPDPITGKTEWGLVQNEAGQIVGIHSLSAAAPLKTNDFDAAHAHFENARTYEEWIFGLPFRAPQSPAPIQKAEQ